MSEDLIVLDFEGARITLRHEAAAGVWSWTASLARVGQGWSLEFDASGKERSPEIALRSAIASFDRITDGGIGVSVRKRLASVFRLLTEEATP